MQNHILLPFVLNIVFLSKAAQKWQHILGGHRADFGDITY
jgi:hypothetical protein